MDFKEFYKLLNEAITKEKTDIKPTSENYNTYLLELMNAVVDSIENIKNNVKYNYIADFYCHRAKLIIEIDGSQHRTAIGKAKDEFRTSILEGYGLKVIRFTNRQIDENFDAVCRYIDSVVRDSL